MKKRLLIIITFLIFTVQSSFAFAPLLIPAAYGVASSVIGVSLASLGTYYMMRSGVASQVSASGAVNRASKVAYIATLAGATSLYEKNVSTSITLAQLQNIASLHTADYPLMNQAVNDKGFVAKVDLAKTNSGKYNCNGKILQEKNTGVFYQMPNPLPASAGGATNSTEPIDSGFTVSVASQTCYSIVQESGANIPAGNRIATSWCVPNASAYSSTPATNPPTPVPRPVQDALPLMNVARNTAPGPLDATLQTELDKMLQDPSYVPAFTDDTTGLPYAPPAGILNPTQLADRNRNGVLTDAQAAAAAAAGAASTAAATAAGVAGTASTAAAAASTAAQAAATANPSDPALAAAAQQAIKDAAAAIAALNIATTAAATAAAVKAKSDAYALAQADTAADAADDSATSVNGDSLKVFDWSAFNSLKGALASTWPFSLLGTVSSYVSLLSISPVAPVFDYPMPLGMSIHIDLAPWDGLALIVRWAISILLTVGGIYYVVHFWRGIS